LIREKDLDTDFEKVFTDLISNEEKRKELSKNIEALALANATNAIVDEVEKLLLLSSQREGAQN
jgi:UDP-N-acetylglucosamine--N-acetylmuramyl-(pentapeptide) pyrophosphoryl-undecaprenol N-acetylglucosamine transferase